MPASAGTSWVSVGVGYSHTAAVRSDGALLAWGSSGSGQLGDGTTVSKSSPVQIGASSWTAVACVDAATAAIKLDGTLWAWGLNSAGQLGDGTTVNKSSPVQIASGSFAQISAGASHFMALDSTNKLWTWGWGNAQQVLNINFDQVIAGRAHTATLRQGTLTVWGRGDEGQLGQGNTLAQSNPVVVPAAM